MGLKTGFGAVPVPLSETACGLPLALSVITSVVVRGVCPEAVGLNTTGMLVVPLGATVIGAAGVGRLKPAASAKSPGLLPLNVSPVICNGALPVLVAVTESGALVVPTA